MSLIGFLDDTLFISIIFLAISFCGILIISSVSETIALGVLILNLSILITIRLVQISKARKKIRGLKC